MILSTRDALKVKAASHKGPSSIFDESIEEAGGIVHCEMGADMPRNVKQISNARQGLKEKRKNKASLLPYLDTPNETQPSEICSGHRTLG